MKWRLHRKRKSPLIFRILSPSSASPRSGNSGIAFLVLCSLGCMRLRISFCICATWIIHSTFPTRAAIFELNNSYCSMHLIRIDPFLPSLKMIRIRLTPSDSNSSLPVWFCGLPGRLIDEILAAEGLRVESLCFTDVAPTSSYLVWISPPAPVYSWKAQFPSECFATEGQMTCANILPQSV